MAETQDTNIQQEDVLDGQSASGPAEPDVAQEQAQDSASKADGQEPAKDAPKCNLADADSKPHIGDDFCIPDRAEIQAAAAVETDKPQQVASDDATKADTITAADQERDSNTDQRSSSAISQPQQHTTQEPATDKLNVVDDDTDDTCTRVEIKTQEEEEADRQQLHQQHQHHRRSSSSKAKVNNSKQPYSETPEVSSTNNDAPNKSARSFRRSSYTVGGGRPFQPGYQNYGLAYLPYKSNFEPSEDARRRADEFFKTLKL